MHTQAGFVFVTGHCETASMITNLEALPGEVGRFLEAGSRHGPWSGR